MLVLERQLEREAFAALVATHDRFQPIAAPSVPGAARRLNELGACSYVALLDQQLFAAASRGLFRPQPPSMAVLLRDGPACAQRCRSRRFPILQVGRDASWRELSAAMLNEQEGEPRPGLPADDPANGDQQRYTTLTRRERQVLELIAQGASVRECAKTLHIAVSTVDNHKSRLMKKVGVHRSAELIRFAFRLGLVE